MWWVAVLSVVASGCRHCQRRNVATAHRLIVESRSLSSRSLSRSFWLRRDISSHPAPGFAFQGLCHPRRGFRPVASSWTGEEDSDAFSPICRSDTPPLTVILPAYNEADRIRETIRSYRSYLEHSNLWGDKRVKTAATGSLLHSDILVVNDGSTDNTAAVVLDEFGKDGDSSQMPGVRCISLEQNCGKGMAIAQGIRLIFQENQRQETQQPIDKGKNDLEMSPRLILIADADGSGNIEDVETMVSAMISLLVLDNEVSPKKSPVAVDWNRSALVVGDRGYRGTSIGRAILRWGFRNCARLLCGSLMDGTVGGVRDTQCGMKLLTLPAAQRLYKDLHLCRWSHDVEVAYRAGRYGKEEEKGGRIVVGNVPIQWKEKEGSKLLSSSFNSSPSDGHSDRVAMSSQDEILETLESLSRTVQISSRMFWDVLLMRINYELGLWE